MVWLVGLFGRFNVLGLLGFVGVFRVVGRAKKEGLGESKGRRAWKECMERWSVSRGARTHITCQALLRATVEVLRLVGLLGSLGLEGLFGIIRSSRDARGV